MAENDNTKDQLLDRIAKLKNRIVELSETVKVLLNATSDLAFLIDTKGKILYINEAAARRFGKNPDELKAEEIFDPSTIRSLVFSIADLIISLLVISERIPKTSSTETPAPISVDIVRQNIATNAWIRSLPNIGAARIILQKLR